MKRSEPFTLYSLGCFAFKTSVAQRLSCLVAQVSLLLAVAGTVRATNFVPFFNDDFNAGASAQWNNFAGNWSASGGVFRAQNPSNGAFNFLPFNLTDFAVNLDINRVADGGVWLRSDGTGANGLLLVTGGEGWGFGARQPASGNSLYFHVVQNGVFNPANPPYYAEVSQQFTADVSNIHLRVEVVGNTYSVFLNNGATPVTTFTDSTFASGRVGLYDFSNQTVDNFSIQVVPEPSALALIAVAGALVLCRLSKPLKWFQPGQSAYSPS